MYTLELTAEKTMDLYLQRYKADGDFFGLEDFVFFCSMAYAARLQEDYNQSYKQAGQEIGEFMANLNSEWYMPVEIEVKKNVHNDDYEAVLPMRPFSFRFDNSFTSIEDIYSLAGNCSDFIRSNAKRKWLIKILPNNPKVFWFLQGSKVVFKNVSCHLKKVRVHMIPSLASLDGKLPIPETHVEDIVTKTLTLMFQARQGKIIDMSADGNPNAIAESELNPALANKYKVVAKEQI